MSIEDILRNPGALFELAEFPPSFYVKLPTKICSQDASIIVNFCNKRRKPLVPSISNKALIDIIQSFDYNLHLTDDGRICVKPHGEKELSFENFLIITQNVYGDRS